MEEGQQLEPMTNEQFRALDIASRIAPGSASWPADSEFVHWTRLKNTVEEARGRLATYHTQCDEIAQDPRLSDAGKKEQRRLAAQKALGAFSGSKSLSRAQQSVGDLLEKWRDKVAASVKPAVTEGESALHAEIRRSCCQSERPGAHEFLREEWWRSDPCCQPA